MMIDVIIVNPFAAAAATIIILMVSIWLASLVLKDAGMMDMFWGGGFALVALASLLVTNNLSAPKAAIAALVILWGMRLFIHLFIRWRKEPEEDYRYQKMRAFHGRHFWWRSFFIVFTLQGVLMYLIAMPYIATLYLGDAAAQPILAWLALLVALAGLIMETLADIQLTRFRATAKSGDLLTDGWWSRTRHPNYFGDALFWWGIYAAVIATTPNAVWTIFAPILMNWLLVKISGAEMLERRLKKKPGYSDYMTRTNRFIPRVF